MTDRMVEKVAQAMFAQDHDEGWGAGETTTKLIYLNNASAALDACHFDELVTALKEIAKGKGPFNRNPLLHAENVIEEAKATANALLAKVEAGDA